MPITEPFDGHSEEYEQWFSTFEAVYDSEVEALKRVMPDENKAGLEIGAGSGLFASRLGLRYGVEPSGPMLEKAKARGIEMKQGAAEELPYPDESFDYTLMVTAICFLDDLDKAMEEMRRVLKPGGLALFGFVDKDSPLGQFYLQHKEEDLFYRPATFYSASEVISVLKRFGFKIETVLQTVFGNIQEITETQEPKEGHGEGGFVVLQALKEVK